ncbi:hypothetical protein O0L34_g4293 [Tuta absoluta]|nr:hypothetical protein O0L34_g4293 [Tuta absoluta]
MWDSLFLHGFGAHCKCGLRIFIIIWIWFTFLINAFYQSNLMSLTTHPSKDYQISTEEDLHRAHLRPCITSAMTNFLQSFADMKFDGDKHECTDMVLALEKVGKSYEVYTIMSYKLYKYNMPLFSSDDVQLYHLREGVMDTIFALFLYKGFPWLPRLEYRALQLKENGLIQRHAKNIYYYHQVKYLSEKPERKRKSRAIVPWELLLVGCVIATFVFIIEILVTR